VRPGCGTSRSVVPRYGSSGLPIASIRLRLATETQGDGVPAGGDDRTRRLELRQPALDPRTELPHGVVGGTGGRAPREHDLNAPDAVDGHPDSSRPVRATHRELQIVGGIAVVAQIPSEVRRRRRHRVNQATVRNRRMPSFPRFPAPLSGDGVQLRLAAEQDIPEVLIAHQDDPQLFVQLRMPRPPSGAELGRRTELADTERALGACLWLTVLTPGSDVCCGQIDVHEAELHYGRTDLDIWIAPGHRGRGLGSGALALAGRWLIGEAALARVQLFIDPDNGPMLAAAANAGFAREGVLRGYWREQGGRRDAEAWSLVTLDLGTAPRS
jgi:ribosomal-protein-alanine N-acetyltransferase